MVARLPILQAQLRKLENRLPPHPTLEQQQKIQEVTAKINKIKTANKERAKKKQRAQKKESKAIEAAEQDDAGTQNVEPDTLSIQAERQAEIDNGRQVVEDAWAKANEAKAAAEKAVQKLKSLRIKGKAEPEKITAARKKIQVRKTRANKLEIAAIFAEDDLHNVVEPDATTGKVEVVDEAHDSMNEDYTAPFMEMDNDDLGPWQSPSLPPNNAWDAPELFLPTPATTIPSPTTVPVSPVKEDDLAGTKDEPIVVHETSASIAKNDKAYDDRLERRFQEELLANNELANLIAEFAEFLQPSGTRWLHNFNVSKYTLMQLFDNVWLDNDIVNLYVEILVQPHPTLQVITSRKIGWELEGLNSKGGPSEDYPVFDIEPNTRSFLIPTFVNNNHWMLCVARLPIDDRQDGTLDWYNSLRTSRFQQFCDEAAQDVVRVLLWLASVPGSPLAGVSWRLNECRSGSQSNSDDCGVFVAATAAAIVLNLPIPQNVDGFRIEIASKVVKATMGDAIDWSTTAETLWLASGVPSSLAENAGDADDKEDARDEGVEDNEHGGLDETGYLCNICWYHRAQSLKDLAIHKTEKHNTEPFLCEWPGCRVVMTDQESLDAHIRHVHERETYFCPIRTCHLRFLTEDAWWEHVREQHPDLEDVSPQILDEQYRTFDLAEMRSKRDHARRIWETRCGSKDKEHQEIGEYYRMYHHHQPREYFGQRGLMGQDIDAVNLPCRTVDREYTKSDPGQTRPNKTYLIANGLTRNWDIWVLLLHQKEGSELDKHILHMCLGMAEVSHKCHWPWCFVVSHLERVLKEENNDRTSCKNGTRKKEGGCNALQSLHPFDPCLLDSQHGTAFDADLPPPVTAPRSGPKKRSLMVTLPMLSKEKPHRPKRSKKGGLKGPCANGHTTTWNGWRYDQEDKSRVLCSLCYQRQFTKRKTKECTRCGKRCGPRHKDNKLGHIGPTGFLCVRCWDMLEATHE